MRFIAFIIFGSSMLYSHRTAAQRSAVLPDFVSLQYAGSIGFVSGGLGYQLSRAASASIHYGYVPQNKGGALNIVAGKLLYNPYTIRISRNFRIDPIQPGIMISYHFGAEFRTNWPAHRYPEGYYWWKTSLRAHVLTQTSVTLALNEKRIHSLTGYIEFNTNELYLISYIKNHRALNLRDIIKVGYGLRAHF